MTGQLLVSGVIFLLGAWTFGLAIRHERLMHRHRQPGISYGAATLRLDGGWRRTELFTPEGLSHQRRASRYALTGVGLWILSLGAWIALSGR